MEHEISGRATTQKDAVAGIFTRAARQFGQSDQSIRRFPYFGRRLVEVANLPIGGRMLDVATGRGAVLFPAVERVGPTGYALGIDLTPKMVEATAQDIHARGLTNVEVRCMDAEQLDFPSASFDALLCGFGFMFFPHLAAALAGFRRVLKPGGILAASTWADPDPNFAWEYDLWKAYGLWDRHPGSQVVQQLDKPAELIAVLGSVGFTAVAVQAECDEWHHADPEEWWTRAFEVRPAGAIVASLGPERAAQFKAEALANLAPLQGPDGIVQRVEANFALARNA